MENTTKLEKAVLVAAMCLLMNVSWMIPAEDAGGQAVPYPIRGYVLDGNGTVVSGAMVTVTRISSGTFTITTTGTDGFYMADAGGLSIANGDSIRIAALKGTETGTAIHSVNLSRDPVNVNVTVETPSEALFSVHFYVVDANGVGVENITLIIHPPTGSNFTLSTEEYGQVIYQLGLGNFTFQAIATGENLYNQSGSFRILDRNINITIDLSKKLDVTEHQPSILGIRISSVCLISLTVCFAIMLGGLFILLHWRWSK